MVKHKEEILLEDYNHFLENFDKNPSLPLEYFHPFQCPVAEAEAIVKEHHLQDYSVFALLLLRLIKAGFGKVSQLVSFSGMTEDTVISFLNRALVDNQCQLVDPKDTEKGVCITDLGLKTLLENEQENSDGIPKAHVVYEMPRLMHIEAVTGTVIPSYMEKKLFDPKPDNKLGDVILPRRAVDFDEELIGEIKSRLDEYVGSDYVRVGDINLDFESIKSKNIFFRWGYLAKFKGMKYPMIVLSGKKKIDNVNEKSQKKAMFGFVTNPLSISRTDSVYLKQNGIVFENTLIRDDKFFLYLSEKTKDFNFSLPDDTVQD